MERKKLKNPKGLKKLEQPKKMNGHAQPDPIGKLAKIKIPGDHPPSPRNKTLFGEYQSDYPKIAAELVLNGATEKDMIVHFKTKAPIFRSWQLNYPEFAAACVITKAASLADANVVRSMYEMANGYDIPATKIMNVEGDVRRISYVERIPKNINAAKFWLANRDPLNWGKDPEKASGGAADHPNVFNINMLRSMDTDQLRNTIDLLQALVKPDTSLKRLDVLDAVDAEVVEVKAEENTNAKKKARK